MSDLEFFYPSDRIDREGLLAAIEHHIVRNCVDLNVPLVESHARATEWVQSEWMGLMWDDFKIIGVVAISVPFKATSKHVGSLRLSVDKHHWNQGHGTVLIEAAIAEAPKLGILRLEATPYSPLSPYKYHLFVNTGGFTWESTMHNRALKLGENGMPGELVDMLMLVRHYDP